MIFALVPRSGGLVEVGRGLVCYLECGADAGTHVLFGTYHVAAGRAYAFAVRGASLIAATAWNSVWNYADAAECVFREACVFAGAGEGHD